MTTIVTTSLLFVLLIAVGVLCATTIYLYLQNRRAYKYLAEISFMLCEHSVVLSGISESFRARLYKPSAKPDVGKGMN